MQASELVLSLIAEIAFGELNLLLAVAVSDAIHLVFSRRTALQPTAVLS